MDLDKRGDARHAFAVGTWRRMCVRVGAPLIVVAMGAGDSAAIGGTDAIPSAGASGGIAAPGGELIGSEAPSPWTLSDWIGSPPLSLAALRGKVVLLRWFTDTACPYCSLTAPALNKLHQDFAARGLVVIGVYHHKRPEPIDVAAVRGWARDYGFQFPVAIDRDWRTLHRWWLDGHKRGFTSVSFLIDQRGIIRYLHPGGSLGLGGADYTELRARIDGLLPR